MEPIFATIFDSRNAIFKEHRRDRAKVTVYACDRPDCPLRARKCCTFAPLLGWSACPYGKVTVHQGPTPRAAGYSKWLSLQKEMFGALPSPGYPSERLAFIGDYVYLPYTHMGLWTGPWLRQAGIFTHGDSFMPKTVWQLDLVLKLILFRPRSLFGDEIINYRLKSVPLFLAHLREEDPAMWAEVIAVRPELDIPPVILGRHALLHTLRSDITIGPYDKRYPVIWHWDGHTLTTHDQHAYNKTWGDMPLGELTLSLVPPANTSVKVTDAAWVQEDTIFID